MSKRSWSGRNLPLALARAQMAYRTTRGNPRGTRGPARSRPQTRRRTCVPQRRFVRARVRIHQPVKQAGQGGSFSNFLETQQVLLL